MEAAARRQDVATDVVNEIMPTFCEFCELAYLPYPAARLVRPRTCLRRCNCEDPLLCYPAWYAGWSSAAAATSTAK